MQEGVVWVKINNELGNNSVLWQQVQDKKKSDKGVPVSDDFSRILQNMREYKPANYDDTIKVDDKNHGDYAGVV